MSQLLAPGAGLQLRQHGLGRGQLGCRLRPAGFELGPVEPGQLVARPHPIPFVGHHAFDPAGHLKAESGFGGLDGARSQEGVIRASAPNHQVDAEH